MAGLIEPNIGEVLINGKTPKELYSHIGYVPQNTNFNLNFPITALEVVLMGHECEKRAFFGYGKHELSCALGALERVGMFDYKDEKIGTLSGGERQRVLIARAICAHNTEILFLDEPTSSLDFKAQEKIYRLLKDLNEWMSIVLVSHDLSVILDYATSICYVNRKITHHDAPSFNQEAIRKRLGIKDNHLCEVDILNSLGSING